MKLIILIYKDKKITEINSQAIKKIELNFKKKESKYNNIYPFFNIRNNNNNTKTLCMQNDLFSLS